MSDNTTSVGEHPLERELDKRLCYVQPAFFKCKNGKVDVFRIFSWRDDDGVLHEDKFKHNQQPSKIVKTLLDGGYNMPLNKKGDWITSSELKKRMFSCSIGSFV